MFGSDRLNIGEHGQFVMSLSFLCGIKFHIKVFRVCCMFVFKTHFITMMQFTFYILLAAVFKMFVVLLYSEPSNVPHFKVQNRINLFLEVSEFNN